MISGGIGEEDVACLGQFSVQLGGAGGIGISPAITGAASAHTKSKTGSARFIL